MDLRDKTAMAWQRSTTLNRTFERSSNSRLEPMRSQAADRLRRGFEPEQTAARYDRLPLWDRPRHTWQNDHHDRPQPSMQLQLREEGRL